MMGNRSVVATTFAAAVLLAGQAAFAEESAAIETAHAMMADGDFEAAVEHLVAVTFDEAVSASVRVEALELIASSLLRLRRRREARQALERLLDLDPEHELQSPEPPRSLRRLYRQVRRSYRPNATVEVSASAPAELPRSGLATIEATISGNTFGVQRVVTFSRPEGDEPFHPTAMTRSGNDFSAAVDPPEDDLALEWYVEAEAPSGHVLGRYGDADDPQLIAPAPRTPWFKSWWFWTVVSTVVAGTATTAVVLSWPEHRDGSLGTMEAP